MSITISGIRITNITICKDSDGKEQVTGDYALISSEDKVLAKQGFNGYSEIKIAYSKETMRALNDFQKGLKDDVQTVLGLKEE